MINIFLLMWLIFGTFIGQIIIVIIGYTILNFLPKKNDFPPLQRLAIVYGLGTGFLSLSMFFSILLGLHSKVSFIPLLILALFIFVKFKIFNLVRQDIKRIIRLIKRLKFNEIEYFCIFLLIIEFFFIISYWFIYPIYLSDAVMMWDAKAKFIFYDGNFNFIRYKPRPIRSEYPLLIPLTLCFFYSIFFQYHYFAKILFVSFFILLILFLYYSFKSFNLNRTYSILICTLLALIPYVFIHSTIAYADLALTFFYTISTIFLFYYFTTKKGYYLYYASIFMGFMAWTKEEGLALLLLNTITFIIYNFFLIWKKQFNYYKSLKSILIYFSLGFLIYLPWILFCFYYNIKSTHLLYILNIYNIESVVSNLIFIFQFLLIPQSNYYASILIFWVVFFIILIVNIKFLLKENNFFLFFLCVSHFLLYLLIFSTIPVKLIEHYSASLDRELLHLTPICCFLIGIMLSKNKGILINFKEFAKYRFFIYGLIIIIVIFIIIDIIFYEIVDNIVRTLYNSLFSQ